MNTRARLRERGMPPRVEEFMRDNGVHRKKAAFGKRKPLQDVSGKHKNSNKENENEGESEGVLKKFKMSSDEKHMNGAPEGELYDVTVLKDHELKELRESNDEITASLSQALANGSSPSSSWADRFAAVELLRRVTMNQAHANILQNDYVLLVAALESCTHAVGSLRSCSVRNGLLAINSLIRTVPLALSYEHGSTLLGALMSGKLLTSGPKFISESTTNLIEDIVSLMDHMVAVKCFALSIDHKNPHVSNTAFRLVAKAILMVPHTATDAWKEGLLARSSASSSSSTGGSGNGASLNKDVTEVFSLLHRGLSAKWPSGRELCRKSLHFLKERFGTSFDALVQSCLGEYRSMEIRREMRRLGDASQETDEISIHASSSSSSSVGSERGTTTDARQGLSRTVPYHKVDGRLDSSASKRDKHAGSGLSSSGRMSVKDQIRADRRAFQEKEVPSTSASGGSSLIAEEKNKNKNPTGGIFIFEDM